ncbi:MAG: replicative DNA helicase [Candidatus Kapaibacterium sp.]
MPISEGNILNEGGGQYPLEKMIGRPRRNVVPMETSGDRVPPHSNDAEMAVLGAMMLDKDAANEAIRILSAEAFYREAHRIIYEAMLSLSERNQPIDIITLNEELRRREKLADVGGSHYLAELNRKTPTTANIEYHSRIVFEKALKRKMIGAAMGIIGSCYSDSTDAFEELDKAEQTIFEISESRNRTSSSSMERLAKETIDMLQEISERRADGGGVVGTPTGLMQLDRLTGGFQKSDLIILAARPSMGKTAIAMSMLRNAAVDYKKPAAFFSLEMSAQQLMLRLISAEAKVNAHRLRTGDLRQEHWQQIVSTIHRLAAAPIYIDDTPALSIMDLRARARLLKREHNIELLIVDYLQLMHSPKSESREREISTISRGLKQLAKELQIPIIALSQLNRSVESRSDKRPMLSDLRESGSIEQDADVVMFVHRPEYYGFSVDEENRSTEGVAEVIVGKQRNGPTGDVRLAFIKEFARFENLDEFHAEADEYLPPASDEDPF